MDLQGFRRMVLWNLLAASLVVALAFIFLHQRTERSTLIDQARRDLAAAQLGFEKLEAADSRLLSSSLEPLLDDDALRSAFLARDRKRLLALATPTFERLKARYGVTHFYFLDPPPSAVCFLRVHSPALYGDKIERSTYALAVKGQGFGMGKELGQTAFALRVVHPWKSKDGKRIIGYIELGEEIGHFLGELKAQTGNDYALLLDKRKLDSVTWMHMRNANGLPNDWSARALYVLTQDTGVVMRDLAWNGSLDKLPAEGRLLGVEHKNGRHLVRGVFPVEDALGQRAGAVLMARDVTEMVQHSQWRHVVSVLAALLALLVIGVLAGWILAADGHGERPAHWSKAFRALPAALAEALWGKRRG